MRLHSGICVCCTSLWVLLIAIASDLNGQRISDSEMAASRGGSPQTMKCSATCNHLNGYDQPCLGMNNGDACFMCNADPDLYYYSQQKQSPPPAYCTVRTNGYVDDPKNSRQGCGFISKGTCKTQPEGGLKCVDLVPSKSPCTTAVTVIDQ